jgi:hypothetical protein
MPSLNDTLTLGLVLILLFGAVSLYLYTRVQQCEQKLNLVESILLDIKMSAELREYPDLPLRPMESPFAHMSQQASYRSGSRPPSPPRTSSPVNEKHVAQEAVDAVEAVEVAVVPFAEEDVAPGAAVHVGEREIAERFVAPHSAVRSFDEHSLSVPSAQPVPKAGSSSGASVGANYESMTLSDLKALAAQRNITGAKSMKRAQILEVLRTSDRAAEAQPIGEVQGFSAFDASTVEELSAIAEVDA